MYCCARDISNSLMLTHLASGAARGYAPCMLVCAVSPGLQVVHIPTSFSRSFTPWLVMTSSFMHVRQGKHLLSAPKSERDLKMIFRRYHFLYFKDFLLVWPMFFFFFFFYLGGGGQSCKSAVRYLLCLTVSFSIWYTVQHSNHQLWERHYSPTSPSF